MKTRFNGYEKTSEEFLSKILVECPKCTKQAIVMSSSLQGKNVEEETKVTCVHCGFNKILLEKPKDQISLGKENVWEITHFYMNTSNDPYFGLPLWLQKAFPEGVLWAYNFEHLNFLEHHIAAELREKSLDNILSRPISSRLPKWMTTEKNRKEILLVLKKLREK